MKKLIWKNDCIFYKSKNKCRIPCKVVCLLCSYHFSEIEDMKKYQNYLPLIQAHNSSRIAIFSLILATITLFLYVKDKLQNGKQVAMDNIDKYKFSIVISKK